MVVNDIDLRPISIHLLAAYAVLAMTAVYLTLATGFTCWSGFAARASFAACPAAKKKRGAEKKKKRVTELDTVSAQKEKRPTTKRNWVHEFGSSEWIGIGKKKSGAQIT